MLSREDRATVDAELASRPGGLGALGDRAVETAARAIAHRLDPYAATKRARRAERDRRVSLRPAPDTMSLLTGLLPVRQGVTVFAALTTRADSLRATGDSRTRGQIMADTLVERLTGHATADAVPVEVHLVMTDQSLIDPDDSDDSSPTSRQRTDDGAASAGRRRQSTTDQREAPAWVTGYGPVPAPLARAWIRDTAADVWVRRLFADPATGALVAMDSRRRAFTGLLRELVVLRDQVCRTPWCDAPIRHVDHIVRAADGGPTSSDNGRGLCAACNLAREAPGWTSEGTSDEVRTTTPTGHQHSSSPPTSSPGAPPEPAPPQSRGEYYFRDLFRVA